MDRRIVVNQKENAHISRIASCIKVVMSDDRTYFLADSIHDFIKLTENMKTTPLVRTMDVFDQSICINPNYIKTIIEGKCVKVDNMFICNGENKIVSDYYVMSSSDNPIISNRDEATNIHVATQIYKPANELSL